MQIAANQHHAAMFVIAHLSDAHLAPVPRAGAAELLSKRGLGLINWYRKRKYVHRAAVLEAIARDVKDCDPDHIAVTGDLVNISLPAEYSQARQWLESLGSPADVTAIPGNHDVYVRGVEQSPAQFWGEFMRGDDQAASGAFPFLRQRAAGRVALIALSSALPTAPLLATGHLGKPQLTRLAALLDQTAGLFRVVLIHHPPKSPLRRYLRRLTDAREFREVLAVKGAELVLHGHDHCHSLIWLKGPHGRIPAAGVPSASAGERHGGEDAAGYSLYRIDGEPGAWRCEMIMRQRDSDGSIDEVGRRVLA